MKLIPNAGRVLLRSYSQQANLISLAGIGGYNILPEKLQDALPLWLVAGLAATLLTLSIVGRLIEQPKLHDDAPP
jgi:hypothetical protein